MRGRIFWMTVVAMSTHLRGPDEPTVTITNGQLHAALADAFAVDLDLEGEPVTIELDPDQPPSIHVGGVNMVIGEQRGHGRTRNFMRKRTGDSLAAGDDSHHEVFLHHGDNLAANSAGIPTSQESDVHARAPAVYHSTSSGGCGMNTFFTYSFERFEGSHPEFKSCLISHYSKLFEDYILTHPCRVTSLAEASVLIFPPYLANECNWPHYGRPWCRWPENVFRWGHDAVTLRDPTDPCHVATIARKAAQLARSVGKKALMLDSSYDYRAGESVYKDLDLIWVKEGTRPAAYRPGVDISMPTAPTKRCDSSAVQSSFMQGLSQKRFLATFIGTIGHSGTATPQKIALRSELSRVGDGSEILIVDSDHNTRYRYDSLLRESRFGLIPRGDAPVTYRFNEVVCSGSVPVLIADKYVPPFENVMPFESYGVRVRETDIADLKAILKAIPDTVAEAMRVRARVMCNSHLRTTNAQFDTVLQSVLTQKSSGRM